MAVIACGSCFCTRTSTSATLRRGSRWRKRASSSTNDSAARGRRGRACRARNPLMNLSSARCYSPSLLPACHKRPSAADGQETLVDATGAPSGSPLVPTPLCSLHFTSLFLSLLLYSLSLSLSPLGSSLSLYSLPEQSSCAKQRSAACYCLVWRDHQKIAREDRQTTDNITEDEELKKGGEPPPLPLLAVPSLFAFTFFHSSATALPLLLLTPRTRRRAMRLCASMCAMLRSSRNART